MTQVDANIKLPKRTFEDIHVTLDGDEKEFYDIIHNIASSSSSSSSSNSKDNNDKDDKDHKDDKGIKCSLYLINYIRQICMASFLVTKDAKDIDNLIVKKRQRNIKDKDKDDNNNVKIKSKNNKNDEFDDFDDIINDDDDTNENITDWQSFSNLKISPFSFLSNSISRDQFLNQNERR